MLGCGRDRLACPRGPVAGALFHDVPVFSCETVARSFLVNFHTSKYGVYHALKVCSHFQANPPPFPLQTISIQKLPIEEALHAYYKKLLLCLPATMVSRLRAFQPCLAV